MRLYVLFSPVLLSFAFLSFVQNILPLFLSWSEREKKNTERQKGPRKRKGDRKRKQVKGKGFYLLLLTFYFSRGVKC